MKKLYIFLIGIIFFTTVNSQTCNGSRYRNFVFQDSSVVNVVYGSNVTSTNATQSLKMDMWMPKADTGTNRPLLILMHGGNFLGGSKSGSDVLQFSKDFSKVLCIPHMVKLGSFNLL